MKKIAIISTVISAIFAILAGTTSYLQYRYHLRFAADQTVTELMVIESIFLEPDGQLKTPERRAKTLKSLIESQVSIVGTFYPLMSDQGKKRLEFQLQKLSRANSEEINQSNIDYLPSASQIIDCVLNSSTPEACLDASYKDAKKRGLAF